jgi:CPA2 family monovalent cation:H+ antiporter-2
MLPLFDALTLASGASGNNALIRDLLIILGAAAIISVLLRRLHLASIPGYLLIGAFLGTLAKFHWIELGSVDEISEIAVILLMFTIGLHLDIETIRTGMVPILIVGAASTMLCGLVLWPFDMLFGLSAPGALLVGMALAMSSTAVAIGILQKNKEVHLIHGRICVGIAIMQDLMAIPLMAMLPALALWAGVKPVEGAVADPKTTLDLISGGLVAIGGIIVMLAFAKFVLPHLLREASWGGNTEALLVASAGAGLSAAMLTGVLGFGAPLGAFLAGFMLSNTPFRFQLAGQLSPLRDLFMAVFFTAVGIKLDIAVVFQYWWVIGIGVIIVMAVKTAVIGICTWGGGATAPISLLVGLVLGQAGEFSLVVIDVGVRKGIIPEDAGSVIVGIVVVSLIAATALVEHGRRYMSRLSRIKPAGWIASAAMRETTTARKHGGHGETHKHAPKPATGVMKTPDIADPAVAITPPKEPEPVPGPNADRHVIIAGFGVVGRNLAEHLAAAGIAFNIVDLNAGTVVRQNELGRKTVYGDIANPDVLESAGLHDAEAVVITIPDDAMALRACETIRTIRPDIFIAARASYLSRAIMAHEAGADHVTIEEVVTAQDMAVKVVEQINRRFKKRADAPHL